MPTINQLPAATDVGSTDVLPISQSGVARSVPVSMLLQGTQAALTLSRGSLLGRVSDGPGSPEAVSLGTGLQIQDGVLLVDQAEFPETVTLDSDNRVLLNDTTGSPLLMPVSLLRGLYTAGQNISIDPDGTIHSTPATATSSSIGAVAVGNGLIINVSGQLSANFGTTPNTIAAGNDSRIVNAEQITNKDQPGGYAGLDSTGLVPSSLLPPGSTNLSGADASAADTTAGFASAVPRTLAAHFSDVLNINDFGLARDGVTDDSIKFTAACQAAMKGNLKLYISAGGPILLTDACSVKLANICIFGDGIRDYSGPKGFGHVGSVLWFTGTTNSPFLLGPCVQFQGLTFFWPNQTEVATNSNNNQPITYPPLFAQQSPAVNIVYFNFENCQVTNCFDFFTAVGTTAVVGACTIARSIIYAVRNCFTLQYVPEVFFISNCLYTWGVYGSVVSVGPTYNLRGYTNTNGCWMKVLGDGTSTSAATTTVGGINSTNNYVFGSAHGVWLSGGTMDISSFVNTSFDNVPAVIQVDTGGLMLSTRFTGGAWYPIYFTQSGNPDVTAILINNPAPAGVGLNCTFSGITIPFINGSFASVTGSNIATLTFSDIRCPNFGHTTGGAGPYYGIQINAPNATVRVSNCDFAASNGGLSNTGIQVLACYALTVSACTLRNLSAPIDVESTTAQVTLSSNTSLSTQGSNAIIGIGTTNVKDLFNSWDRVTYAFNGYSVANYRAGATIGVQPVASTTTAGYVGLQPSATGSSGGTRFGITAFGTSPVSLLTNAFAEEQFRANRVSGAVNYVAVRGSLTGSPTLITTNGADTSGSIQLAGSGGGPVYLGIAGTTGSPVVHLGATADQSYVGYTPASGFSITVPANSSTILLKPAATLATGTMVLPAALLDGEKIEIWSSKAITALTVTGTGGAVVNNGTAFALPANSSVSFIWNAPNNTWFQRLGGSTSNGSISQQDANNVTITGGSVTGLSALGVGSNVAVSANLILNTAAGFGRQIVFESAGLPRFVLGAQGNAENTATTTLSAAANTGDTSLSLSSTTGITTGMLVGVAGVPTGTTVTTIQAAGVSLSQSVTAAIANGTQVTFYTNQGSDFSIVPYDDLGNSLAGTVGQPLTITRATGAVTIKYLTALTSAAAPTPPTGDASTNVATTAFVANTLSARTGAANGIAALDANGKVPASQLPASAQGALSYQGAWNATTNNPVLASSTGTKGFYYTVGTAGTTALDGITQWNVADHAAFNGTVWEKLDGLASEVVSVAGRTGTITLAAADIAGLGSLATQAANAVAITGGAIAGLSSLAVGSSTGTTVTASLSAAAGNPRQFVYFSGSNARWNLMTQADTEGTQANTTAAAATTASTTLTVTSATGIAVGMSATGAGISAGTLVTAIAGTTLNLSAPATVANGAALTFNPNTGSSFAVRAYDDTGNLLFAPLSFSRAYNGALTLGTLNYGPVVVSGSGATVAGGTRGTGAFDAQQYRTAATQVASGQGAFTAGQNNTASGYSSFTAGFGNVADGSYSTCNGVSAYARGRYGASAWASGYNAAAGDSQTALGMLHAASTASAGTVMTADGAAAGSANVWNIPATTAYLVRLEILGFSPSSPLAVSYYAKFRVRRGSNKSTTVLSNTTITADADNDSITGLTAPTLAADTANGGITLTSGFSTANTMRWVARILSAVEAQ